MEQFNPKPIPEDIQAQVTALSTQKVNVSDIVDNLNTSDATKPLSAKQGKALNDQIANVRTFGNETFQTYNASPKNGINFYGEETETAPYDGLYALRFQTNSADSSSSLQITINGFMLADTRTAGVAYEKAEVVIPLKAGTTIKYKYGNSSVQCQIQSLYTRNGFY